MDISLAVVWWVLAGSAIVLEMLTGTLYLLMLALGMVCAAVAVHLGFGITGQLLAFAIFSMVAIAACFWAKKRRAGAEETGMDGLDIGQRLYVDEWAEDGTASVRYRGASWQVELQTGQGAKPGEYRIVSVVGSRLLVTGTDNN